MKSFLLIVLITTLCSACGQKGPLYRAPDLQDNQAETKTATREGEMPLQQAVQSQP